MLEIRLCFYECALALAHLLPIDGEEAVHEEFVGGFELCAHQHCRPEQSVEIHNVLTDEMVKLVLVAVPDFIEVKTVLVAVVFARSHISNRCVEPDIEVFILFARDLKAEVRPVTRNVPVL